MGARFHERQRVTSHQNCSKLLEFAAADDLAAFIRETTDQMGASVDQVGFWYGRSFAPVTKMAFEERTPLMIASLYGSTQVLKHIIATRKVDVNRACGSDGATALHCAAAGGSGHSIEVVRLLIDGSADINAIDVNGRKPGNLIASCVKFSNKILEMLLNRTSGPGDKEDEGIKTPREKREYAVDISLPDINNGLYGTDDFRMYSFKVKPCSRAYSHDWTECPFAHPGENARRRDPRKYHYTCVPCPEFKKGSCARSDSCEYAHGVFESWLHPAQYRTRLCKDETGCARKVCFFAHRPEDLRPLYASTGSGMPSPKSGLVNSTLDMSLSPLNLGSPSFKIPNTSTPPLSPSLACSSPIGGGMWQNNLTPPPALQLSGSRLKTSFSARNMDLDMDFVLGSDNIRSQQRQQLIEEMVNNLSSPYGRMGDLNPTNLDDVFGSPTGLQTWQQTMNNQQVRSSYPLNMLYGYDSSSAVMNARSSAIAKHSQSFNYRAGIPSSPSASSPNFGPQWGSPDGKLEWGFRGDDVSKLRKSASFGNRNAQLDVVPGGVGEPDVSWVSSLVKDVPGGEGAEQGVGQETMPHWFDQVCIEQEQTVA